MIELSWVVFLEQSNIEQDKYCQMTDNDKILVNMMLNYVS